MWSFFSVILPSLLFVCSALAQYEPLRDNFQGEYNPLALRNLVERDVSDFFEKGSESFFSRRKYSVSDGNDIIRKNQVKARNVANGKYKKKRSGGASMTYTTTTSPCPEPTCANPVAVYGQCGGYDYSGSTCCASGSYCKYSNEWYSQCLPNPVTTTTTTTTITTTTTASAPSATSTCPSVSSSCMLGGTGSDGCTPYTVTADGITLTDGSVFEANEDVNYKAIPCSQYTCGQTYTHPGNWSNEESFGVHTLTTDYTDEYIGQKFIPFSGAVEAFPNGYCIIWVQVSLYNQHFGEGGQQPVCNCVAY